MAASSLTEAMVAVGKSYEEATKTRVIASFDASSRLAKQIEQGAPVDLFFSADRSWTDYLVAKKVLKVETSVNLLTNRLVLITSAKDALKLASAEELKTAPVKHFAIAHATVPAGKYGMEILRALGAEKGLKGKMVLGDNVRRVLAWVAMGEAELGIVFATDAQAERKVRTLLNFDPKLHSPVIYSLSIVNEDPTVRAFYQYCQGPEARKIFTAAGFTVL